MRGARRKGGPVEVPAGSRVAMTTETPGTPLFGLDNLLARRPSLARWFFYVGRKVAGSPELRRQVDLPYQSLD
jgi:hypothetical protein